VNRDPIEERGGANLYSFVFNNPTNNFDALGQMGYYPHGAGGCMFAGACTFEEWEEEQLLFEGQNVGTMQGFVEGISATVDVLSEVISEGNEIHPTLMPAFMAYSMVSGLIQTAYYHEEFGEELAKQIHEHMLSIQLEDDPYEIGRLQGYVIGRTLAVILEAILMKKICGSGPGKAKLSGSQKIPMDKTGRLGGRVLSPDELKNWQKELKKNNIDLITHADDQLELFEGANFTATNRGGVIKLRKDATFYEFYHERVHAMDRVKFGHDSYRMRHRNYTDFHNERRVLDSIMKDKHLFTEAEISDAFEVYGRYQNMAETLYNAGILR
jgi:hypothetical protein